MAESVAEALGGYESVITPAVLDHFEGMLAVTAFDVKGLAVAQAARDEASELAQKYTAERLIQDGNVASNLAAINKYRARAAELAREALDEGEITVTGYIFLAAASASREPEISAAKLRLIAREAEMLGAAGNAQRPMVYRNGTTIRAYLTDGVQPAVRPDGTVAIAATRPEYGHMEVTVDPRELVESAGGDTYRPRHNLYVGPEAIANMATSYLMGCTHQGRVVQNAAGMVNELAAVGIDLNDIGVPEKLIEMALTDMYGRVADVTPQDVSFTVRAIYALDNRTVAEVTGDLEQAVVRGLADSIIEGSGHNMTALRVKAHILLQNAGNDEPSADAVQAKADDMLDSARRMASWAGVPKR